MVAAGTVCVFHVGSCQEAAREGGSDEPPRWDFFIGDAPHAPELDSAGRRQPMAQIADADRHSVSGEMHATLGYSPAPFAP